MNKNELLKINLKRFDSYISAAHTKANYLISFNTFILGTLIIKYNDLLKNCQIWEKYSLWGLMLIAAICAFIALIFCFYGSNIYLCSNNESGKYHSLLFFGSINDLKEETYIENINKLNDNKIDNDLSKQTYSLAKGCYRKYKSLKKAHWITLWGVLLPSGLILITRLVKYL